MNENNNTVKEIEKEELRSESSAESAVDKGAVAEAPAADLSEETVSTADRPDPHEETAPADEAATEDEAGLQEQTAEESSDDCEKTADDEECAKEESVSTEASADQSEADADETDEMPVKACIPDPKPKPELTREERFRLELEELARKHMEDVARNVELAKNPALYDTYEATCAGMDEKIRIFSARRQGRSHISGKIPCQDYCLVADIPKGVILTDADGVGSCARSDVGSRLACEETVAFIRELDEQCETEEQLVNRLCTLRFRELLVKRWLKAALTHAKENPDESVNPNKLYELYGSTLLFAVITEHYYVVGNLGDGQILLFNEYEGVKLRLHPPKESTKVRALVNPNCYREDFQVNKFSRKDFSGVLLSTDGMYDILCNSNVLYQYARQIEKRFLSAGEPLQPFCYIEGEEPMKDLFSHRTKDDCSIVLAVDTAFVSDGLDRRIASVGTGMDITVLYRLEGDTACYLLEKNEKLLHGVVTPEEKKLTDLAYLSPMEGIRLVLPLSRYMANGYRYSIYPATDDRTLEELYHHGVLREQTERTPNASKEVLRIYGALLQCKRALKENGYCLTPAAPALMRFGADGGITLPAEAVMPLKEGQSDDPAKTDRFFDSLMGKLVSGDEEYPVFRLGYISAGQRMFLSDRPQEPMYRVTRDAQGTVMLLNQGSAVWDTSNGTIAPKERLPLKEGGTFSVPVSGDAPLVYRYVSKEEM